MADKIEILVEMNDATAKQKAQQWVSLINQLNNSNINLNLNVNTSGLNNANQQVSNLQQRAISLEHALSGLGGAFSTVGGALQGIGNIFSVDLLGTVERTLTAYGTILATQGFKSAITRYDIMTTYADYMEIMGVSADKADESLERVNQAIQGIPVGLDTAAQEIRMFTMYLQGTGDSMDEVADKATNLTIGLERALVAGGASEAMKTTAKYEMQRLLATGSLTTKRQWQALLNGLGVSGQYLKDVMGYGDMSTQDFISDLTSGSISTDAFIEGIAGLADYEGLNKAIDIYKTTIEAGMYDIKFAVTRGFANTFMTIDEVLEEQTGKGIRHYMQDIRQGVNDMFFDIQDWIKDHPEAVTMVLDKLNDIMARAKELNIGQLMADIATQGGKMVDFFLKLYDALPEGWLRQFATFSLVWATPVGRLFSGIGTILSTLGRFTGILGRIPFFGRGSRGGVSGVTGIGTMFGGLGGVAGIGLILYEYAKVMETIGNMEFGNWESNFNQVLTFVTAMGAIVAGLTAIGSELSFLGAPVAVGEGLTAGFEGLIAGFGLIIYEFAKIAETVSNIDISNYDENMKKITALITWVGKFVGVSTIVGTGVAAIPAIGPIAEAIGLLVTGGILGEISYAGSIIAQFANVAQTIADTNLGSNFDTKVTEFANGIQAIYNALPKLTDAEVTGSRNYYTFYTNMAGAIRGMGETSTALNEAEQSFNLIKGKTESLTNMATEIATGLGNVYDALNDAFGLGYAAKWGSKNYPKIIENMSDSISKMQIIASKMKSMDETLKGLDLGLSGEVSTIISEQKNIAGPTSGTKTQVYSKDSYQELVDRIKEMLKGVTDIMDVLGDDAWSAFWTEWKTQDQYKVLTNLNEAIGMISTLATTVSESESKLDSLNALALPGQNMMGGSKFEVISFKLKRVLEVLNDLIRSDEFRNLGGMGDGMIWQENIKAIATIMGDKGIGSIIESVGQMPDRLKAIDDTQAVSSLRIFMNDIYDILGVADSEEMGGKASQIEQVVSSLQGMFNMFADTDLSDLDEVLQNIIDKLANQAIPLMQDFRDAEKEAADQAKSLSTWISQVNTAMVYSKDRIAGMLESLGSLVVGLNSANIAAQNLASAINSIPRRVDTNVNVLQGGDGGYVLPWRRSNGGPIYRAWGGPIGTDTVPAWLTPGEFVMRTQAVKTFGEQFMANINALNIPGALNALVRHYTVPQNAHVNNISNRDNHAVVNQYITTDNPNYSYARASKYVRAL